MSEFEIFKGSHNIFKDLGHPKADEIQLRAELLREVSNTIESRKLTQKDVMRILDVKQPEASYLMNGKLSRSTARSGASAASSSRAPGPAMVTVAHCSVTEVK